MKRKVLSTLLAGMMIFGSLAGCGKTDTGSASKSESSASGKSGGENSTSATSETKSGEDPKSEKKLKILSIWAEDNDNGILINDICKQYQKDVNPNFSYEYEYVSSDDLTTKIATLASSNDLPDIFVYESGKVLSDMVDSGTVVNISKILEEFGCEDKIMPSAETLLKTLSDTDDLYDLPLGLNVEGFWYNKKLFKQAGIDKTPETWEDFEEDLKMLKDAGIQPLTTGGADGWPATRLVNAYTVRSMGYDAMKKAADGDAKYTEKGYVKAAEVVQNWAKEGYFGKGISTVDSNTAGTMLCNDKAAIYYNGAWFTQNLTDSSYNPGGDDAIGFFNIPVVDEKVSDITSYSMNCGNVLCFSQDKYDDATGWFIKYFVENIGNLGMEKQGTIKGYTYDAKTDATGYTKMVLDEINKSKEGFTWYEATMPAAVSTTAQQNVKLLLSEEMSPEDYMQSIQDAKSLAD